MIDHVERVLVVSSAVELGNFDLIVVQLFKFADVVGALNIAITVMVA